MLALKSQHDGTATRFDPMARTEHDREPKPGNRCYLFMAQHNDREPNPQEAQRDGQGAISQDRPLRGYIRRERRLKQRRSPRRLLRPN